jgi:hypothetical protein
MGKSVNSEHRAAMNQREQNLFPAIALTSLQILPIASASFAIILLKFQLGVPFSTLSCEVMSRSYFPVA